MDLTELAAGRVGEARAEVDDAKTARAMGSGSEAVFATPAMIALMEAAAVACIAEGLPNGCISLGTHLDVAHVAATPAGASVTARAELVARDERTLRFAVTAHEGEKLIGQGTHTRAVVERARFLTKLGLPV